MKVELNTKEFRQVVGQLAKVAPTRTTLPAISNMLLEARQDGVTATASDLETTLQRTLSAVVTETGSTLLPARAFAATLRAVATPSVLVQTFGDKVRVDNTVFTSSDSPENYPPLSPPVEKLAVVEGLQRELERIVPCASAEDSRPVLTGVCFTFAPGLIELAAADGYRLAVGKVNSETQANRRIIVPAKSLRYLPKDGPLTLLANEKAVAFESLSWGRVLSSLTIGTYPNYHALIPNDVVSRLTLGDDFLSAVRQAAPLAAAGSGIIRLVWDHLTVKITAQAEGEGTFEQIVSCGVEGETGKLAVSQHYLLDALAVLVAPYHLHTAGLSAPMWFEEDGYVQVVMPMFVQW